MNPFKRSHSLVRTVILYSAVLAIVGVVFAVVQYLDRGGRPAKAPTAQKRAAPAPAPVPADRGDKTSGIKIREELPAMTAGAKSSIRIYSPDSNIARMEILVRQWRPTGQRSDEFEVIEPEIRFRTPNGQEIRVLADRGVVEMTKTEGGAYDLRRGTLTGDVVFEMDRLSAEERQALPADQRNARPPADRLVWARMDDVEFDLEAARIATDGPFRAGAVEGEIAAVGLLVRYNELYDRVEHLEITRGKEIILRQPARSMRIAIPGATQVAATPATQDVPTPDEEATGAGPLTRRPENRAAILRRFADAAARQGEPQPESSEPPRGDDPDVPLLLAGEPKPPKPGPILTYEAVFRDAVEVRETLGYEVTRKLVADTLAFLFDLRKSQRQANGVEPPGESEPPDQPPATRPAEPDARPEIRLSWSGRLEVELLGADAADATGERFHVVATGDPVRLRDRQGDARCRELEYHNETEQVWLRSHDGEDVIVHSSQSGRMAGREVFFDRKAGQIRVTGPGRLSDARPRPVAFGDDQDATRGDEHDVDVRFKDELIVTLGTFVAERQDPLTLDVPPKESRSEFASPPRRGGAPRQTVRREYLQSAVFTGDVLLAQEDGSIAGDRVELDFAPPGDRDSVADTIERVHAEGEVVLTHGDDRIACDRLNVEMDIDEEGKVSPRRAEATGHVTAGQGDRWIRARDRMIVDLRLYERPKPPFDLARARAVAAQKGLDPQTVDWDQARRDYEAKTRYGPGLRRLQAFGQVNVRDPGQNLEVTADFLDCSFVSGRRIDKARVRSEGPSPASAELGDYSVQGRLIDLDVGRQFAQVPGAGRLTFNSRKDLDGRELKEPVLVSVTWTNRMSFHGQANKAVFEGAVHAASQGSMFDCDRLAIDFEDVPPEESGQDTPRRDWWVFTPLFERDQARDDADRVIGPRLNKEPVFLAAAGGATALSSNVDERTGRLLSRVRIAADAIDLDLKQKLAVIEQAGNLLIEDYKLPKRDAPRRGDRATPFGGFGGDGPSQTYLTWDGSMAYNFRFHTASFEKDVEMIHRSGAKLVLRDQFARTANFETDPRAETEGGRDARLTCRSLFVQFRKQSSETRDEGLGLGGLSGYDLDRFQADKNVYFEDSGVAVIAARITYDREQTLLTIFGHPSEPAQIHDQRTGYRRITGPVIYWNRTTNRIEAPDSKIFSR